MHTCAVRQSSKSNTAMLRCVDRPVVLELDEGPIASSGTAEVIRELVGACFPSRNIQNGSQSSSNHQGFADKARLGFIDLSLAFEYTDGMLCS